MTKKLLPKSEFTRNVLTLLTGTSIAQAIPIAVSPILTRIYTPENFGVFALYMSIVSILSVIVTGRYQLAIMLPKKDEEAMNLAVLSLTISMILSSVIFVCVLLFNAQITSLLGNPEISNWLYLLPLSLMISSIYTSLDYWVNRKKRYKQIATVRVFQSASTATTNVGMAFSGFGTGGLILSSILGSGLATIGMGNIVRKNDWELFKRKNKLKIFALAKRYINFPKFDVLASLSNVSAQEIVHIFFNTLYGSTISGYFYLTQRVLGAPITFLSAAVLDVFKEEAASDYVKNGNAKKIFISTFYKLIILSFVPSVILYLYSVEIFVLIFGDNWAVAGEYTKMLVPMLFFRFITGPLSFMFYIGGKQHLNLYAQITLLILIVFSFYLSTSAKGAIVYISVFSSLFYLVQLVISANIAGVFTKGDQTA